MKAIVKLYSTKSGEIAKFLESFKKLNISDVKDDLLWQKEYENPLEIADIIRYASRKSRGLSY